jgi:hypothetical protein
MQRTDNIGLYKWLTGDTKIMTINESAANAEILDEEISARVKTADLPYDKVGNAASFNSSVYLPNNDNLFGYDSTGSLRSIATVQDNDIMDFGNTSLITWIRGKDYVSLRTPKVEIVTQSNSDGTAAVPARELYHVGNSAHHAMLQCTTGTQTLTQNAVNLLTALNLAVSSFPSGALSANNYTIPRTGIYSLEFTAKVTTALTAVNSYLRFGVSRNRGGTVTDIDIKDILASSSYGTPFIGTETMMLFNAGDIITPWIKPLNENVTIGAGSKFNVNFRSDSPSA